MATYAEQIAQWRQQRAQQQIADRVNQIRQEHTQVIRERDQAIADNDMETAELRDMDCQQLEQEHAQYVRPQQPPMDQRLARWGAMNKDYIDRLIAAHGNEKVTHYLNTIDQRLTAPKNPYGGGGFGLSRYSQDYFDRGKDWLQLYSEQDTGIPYEPNATLTADEAAKISGLSPKAYNQAAQEIGRQGRFSWQQKR